MSNVCATGSCSVEYSLAENPLHSTGTIELCDRDLRRFGKLRSIVKSFRTAMNGSKVRTFLDGPVVRVECIRSESMDGLVEDAGFHERAMARTMEELVRNAARADPLLHAEATTTPHFVPLLQAVAQAHQEAEAKVILVSNGRKVEVPVLDLATFVQPTSPDQKTKKGTFRVIGLIRDDKHGHGFLLGTNKTEVRLPRNGPQWGWERIGHVLDESPVLVGSIEFDEDTQKWLPSSGAFLESQPRLIA